MKAEIIALGETHHGLHTEAIKEFLASAPELHGIFKEEVQDYQPSINFYLKTGKLDDYLDRFFDRAAIRGNPIRESTVAALSYSRQHDLPVVCVDSSKVKTEKYSHQSPVNYMFIAGESRDEDMFNSIKDVLKEGEKWLLIGGYQHLKLGIHIKTGRPTLGERLKDYIGDGYKLIVLPEDGVRGGI